VASTLCNLAILIVETTGNVSLRISRTLLDEIMLLKDLKIVCTSESNVSVSFKNVLRKFVVFPVATTGCILIVL
jgi:hypothetical protein